MFIQLIKYVQSVEISLQNIRTYQNLCCCIDVRFSFSIFFYAMKNHRCPVFCTSIDCMGFKACVLFPFDPHGYL